MAEAKHYLLVNGNDEIEAWAFTFLREAERWFAIILGCEVQGQGKGTALLSELKKAESKLNGWVIDHENDFKQNGESYKSPLLFYVKNGFAICEATRMENEKISAVKITWSANLKSDPDSYRD